jgi:hypothetical protein
MSAEQIQNILEPEGRNIRGYNRGETAEEQARRLGTAKNNAKELLNRFKNLSTGLDRMKVDAIAPAAMTVNPPQTLKEATDYFNPFKFALDIGSVVGNKVSDWLYPEVAKRKPKDTYPGHDPRFGSGFAQFLHQISGDPYLEKVPETKTNPWI